MAAPAATAATALQGDFEHSRKALACWLEFRTRLLGEVTDFNGTCGEPVWSAAAAGGPEEPLELRAIGDALDSVKVSLDRSAGKIRCRFGPHAQSKVIEFSIGSGLREGLWNGSTPISTEAALDLILMPLLPPEFSR